MKNLKILAAAAGFAVAAGALTAGNIYVGSEQVGSYSGNVTVTGTGDIRFPTGTNIGGTDGGETGGGGETLNCGQNATQIGSSCECDTGYVSPNDGGTIVDEGVDCVFDDGSSGGGGQTPANCSGVGVNADRDTGITAFSPFPGNSGTKTKFTIETGSYIAARFTAPSSSTYGNFDIIGGTHASGGQLTLAISECPGDFSQALPNGNSDCRATKATHQFWWSTANYQYVCNMQPGKEYYVNMMYASGSGNNLTNSTCSTTRCGAVFTWRN